MARKRGGGGGGGGGGHDGGGGMRWLLTYSDLITLMMAFFVIMYAMSKVDVDKYQTLASSLKSAFNTSGGAGSNMVMPYSGSAVVNTPMPNPDAKAMGAQMRENAEFNNIAEQVQQKAMEANADVKLIIDERGLTIRFMDNIFFDLGKADLHVASLSILSPVGQALQHNNNGVRVEGYTDNWPITTAQFPSNWELSAARAISVTRHLIQTYQLNPTRFSALGYGEYKPLYPNDTPDNRARNRRVDIVILRTTANGQPSSSMNAQ